MSLSEVEGQMVQETYGPHDIAGMAEFFENPSVLVGKEMPILVNIESRKFQGYESQGMIIAADVSGCPILLHPEKEIPPGSKVK